MTENGYTLASLTTRLTERDMAILSDVYEHQTLTTYQLASLHFPDADVRRARRRLLLLYDYGILGRFRRHSAQGKLPDHWILAPVGAEVLALYREEKTADLGLHHDHRERLAYSKRLGHVRGLAECFVRFTEEARNGAGELVCWYGERKSASRWGNHIRPDAYVRWRQGQGDLRAFFEYDTGSESLTKVRRKMTGYANLALYSDVPSVVLFAVHSDQREDHLAAKLAGEVTDRVAVYITTHARLGVQGPAEAVWRATDSLGRLRLVDIALRHPVQVEGQR